LSYYAREQTTHLDGSLVFHSPEDEQNESAIAAELAAAWQCHIYAFGALCPVDWYAERHGRLVGLLELKTRSHIAAHFPTVFLSLRKWLALMMASLGTGVPALFIVRFADGTRWIRLADVEAHVLTIRGTHRIAKTRSDREPLIEVPVDAMTELEA